MSLRDTTNHEKNRRWVPGVNGAQPTKSFRDRGARHAEKMSAYARPRSSKTATHRGAWSFCPGPDLDTPAAREARVRCLAKGLRLYGEHSA
jgi:hypothetical protein